MIVLLFIFIFVNTAAALPAWTFGKKRVRWYRWDYGVPVYGYLAWFVLSVFDLGATASLSNFVVEVFWIFVASALSPWLRIAFPGRGERASRVSSIVFLSVPVVVAVALRLTMPTLPE